MIIILTSSSGAYEEVNTFIYQHTCTALHLWEDRNLSIACVCVCVNIVEGQVNLALLRRSASPLTSLLGKIPYLSSFTSSLLCFHNRWVVSRPFYVELGIMRDNQVVYHLHCSLKIITFKCFQIDIICFNTCTTESSKPFQQMYKLHSDSYIYLSGGLLLSELNFCPVSF